MYVTRRVKAALAGVSLAVLASGASFAAAAPAKPAPATASQIEPGALQALARMSAYLRTNNAFQVTSSTQRDEVDDYGQTVTLIGQTTYKVKSPNAFDIEVADGGTTRNYIYDGKSVTVFDPKTSFYARFNAPPTIRQTLDDAGARFGITVPLDDLFHWDQGDDGAKRLTSAHFVGKANVAGQEADQYAFRQPGVDWQIWIASGAKPFPLRVVIVASDDPARPRFQSDLAWDTTPKFAADTFVFTPPPGAKAIPIVASAR
jgi:hypothetical protein